ncbi:MAG: DMT family transporter [Saprospiraceae bacterium]|nr:DMT family transporter [Saprospiraceae bacterium]
MKVQEKHGPRYQLEAVLLVVAGAIFFSTKAVMVKLAYRHEITAIYLLLLRMLFSLPFYVAIYWYVSNKTPKKQEVKKDYLYVVLFGVLGYYVASYFDFWGLQFISAGLERIILFIYPTLVVMINFIFFKKAIRSIQIFAILITYLGVLAAFVYDTNVEDQKYLLFGGTLVFLSALTYGSYLVGSEWLIPKFGTLRFTALAMMVSCVCVILHTIFVNGFTFPIFQAEVYWYALAMAIFATVLPSFMISEGIKRLGSSNASIIASVGPISTIILSNIFLGEAFNFGQLIGTVLVIFGVILVSKAK